MNWKKENIKSRYIDEITDEEAHKLAFLACGAEEGEEFKVTKIEREVNDNNIPNVKIYYKYIDSIIYEEIESYLGIFEDLNIYDGDNFGSTYSQKEIFEEFKKMGFE